MIWVVHVLRRMRDLRVLFSYRTCSKLTLQPLFAYLDLTDNTVGGMTG